MPAASDYFTAAQILMADGDPSRVTIDALCKLVGTTSGSFYHHFGSLSRFVESFAADWVNRMEDLAKRVTIDPSDLGTARRMVNDEILRHPHQQEAAIRAWAQTDATTIPNPHPIRIVRRILAPIWQGWRAPHKPPLRY